ncbi:class I SAM-dependent methyltransferase [Dinoroseobacter sp. S76]|uniref:class I SAM-dependent methyltransferase n=1 Tax=Dinoroseobacter sp. S76 TaxID=3415124 RepID=UPI003C7E8890
MQTMFSQDPSPSFWDKTAPSYAKKPIKDPAAYAAKLDTVRARLRPTDHVLEIGCGTGSTALALAPSVARYTATDVSQAMIDIAEGKQRTASAPNLHFAVADAAQLMAQAPFEAVLSFSLLHLVEDLPAVLRVARDQLRPGGLFLSKTVCMGEANVLLRGVVRGLSATGFAPPVQHLTRDRLCRDIRLAGFQIDTCLHFGDNRLSPFIVARKPG